MDYYGNELFKKILESKNPIEFFKTNKHQFQSYNLKEQLDRLLREKNVSKSQIIADSAINTTYAYHIFSGDKKPSREKILALAFAFRLNIEETQNILRHSEAMELYVLNMRDAVIIYSLVHNYSLMKTNNLLHEVGEKIIE